MLWWLFSCASSDVNLMIAFISIHSNLSKFLTRFYIIVLIFSDEENQNSKSTSSKKEQKNDYRNKTKVNIMDINDGGTHRYVDLPDACWKFWSQCSLLWKTYWKEYRSKKLHPPPLTITENLAAPSQTVTDIAAKSNSTVGILW